MVMVMVMKFVIVILHGHCDGHGIRHGHGLSLGHWPLALGPWS